MPTLQAIIETMNNWAPAETAARWDNVGLQIGDPDSKIQRVLIALEVDKDVLSEIQTSDYDLLITHHPLFFSPIKTLDFRYETGKIVKAFIESKTQLFCAHTNLDVAKDGVNDTLVKKYGLDPRKGQALAPDGFGAYFELDAPQAIQDFLNIMPHRLAGDTRKETVSRIAFCAGSGKSMIQECIQRKVDLFITGEAGYHDEVTANTDGLALALLGHKESEVPVLPIIQSVLERSFPSLSLSVIGSGL